jgi:mono/diheme cytochrome c family protein
MINKTSISVILLLCGILFNAAGLQDDHDHKKTLEAYKQRSGNAAKGYEYLVTGNYVSSGIPYDFYQNLPLRDSSNVLNRKGEAAYIPPQFNLIENTEGVKLVSPNCLSCHSDYINGEFVVGLGNTSFDYSTDVQSAGRFMATIIEGKYGKNSKEWQAFEPFYLATGALQGNLLTETRGVNPADKLTAVLIAHRDPSSLEWSNSPLLDIPEVTIPTDVPPWWHLKKKNAMFYTAIGRGDFSKFLMASSILTLSDSTEARKIDERFPDVLAWINQLEAPDYPGSIDEEKANYGKKIFDENCASCHGNYGLSQSYPNLLISLEKIGTDPALSMAYTDSLYRNFIDWYNQSWFTECKYPGKLVIESGYVAPPLDGIWATAPYFHNGSVPTVEAVLNSKDRPERWSRSFDSTDYDFQNLGWNYQTHDESDCVKCYDTSKQAYGNMGHTFGDKLDQDERYAVIEYLKTL